MVPLKPLGYALFYLVLFMNVTLAALQNVTVDDAVLVGTVVPQYLPTPSDWNIGNDCSGCLVKPDASLAYNGTWHDTTYSPTSGYTQAVELTFTGSAVYIFFIIANTVPFATTLTSVEFMLDNSDVGSYTHDPDNTTDILYDVPVYTNDELASGQHTLTIQPINTGNNVLMLFDYFIYSMDTSTSVSSTSNPSTFISSPSVTSFPSASSSPTFISSTSVSPFTSASSASASSTSLSPSLSNTRGPKIDAIVGGTVGGVAVLVAATGFLLCYKRHKNRRDETTVEPFVTPRGVASTSPMGATLSIAPMGSSFRGASSSKAGTPSSSLPLLIPTSSDAPTSAGVSSDNNVNLLGQVELLRDEVARLRNMHSSSNSITAVHSEEPPEYTD